MNMIGVDINLLVDHEHWHNQLQFLSRLGPRKAIIYIQKMKCLRKPLQSRAAIYTEGILEPKCLTSSSGFTKVRVPPERKGLDSYQYNSLDQTRIHPRNYESVYMIVNDVSGEGGDSSIEKGKHIVNDLIANPKRLAQLKEGEELRE